jgi:hypothetical protein
LAAVLFVLAVAVDFALAAAVTILVDAMAGSVAFAAARDRVIRLGGESMILDLCAGVRACVRVCFFLFGWASRQWVYLLLRWVSGLKRRVKSSKNCSHRMQRDGIDVGLLMMRSGSPGRQGERVKERFLAEKGLLWKSCRVGKLLPRRRPTALQPLVGGSRGTGTSFPTPHGCPSSMAREALITLCTVACWLYRYMYMSGT